jgi:hypothetical protein
VFVDSVFFAVFLLFFRSCGPIPRVTHFSTLQWVFRSFFCNSKKFFFQSFYTFSMHFDLFSEKEFRTVLTSSENL